MKSKSQLLESIDRFQNGFWEKKHIDRPAVGVVPIDIFMPIKYLRKPFSGEKICPEDVNEGLFANDYEYAFSDRDIENDDFMPFVSAWRAIPWLETICGCPALYSTGSLAGGHYVKSVGEFDDIEFPASAEWISCLEKQTHELVKFLPEDCWVSPTILRGASDVLSAMRGLTEFYCDIYDDISVIDRAAEKVTDVFLEMLRKHFAAVEPKLGGYGHIYGYWAPNKTIVIQEDAMGMCSPDTYRDVFMKYNAKIVDQVGRYVLFHLHSTGFKHYKDILSIEGIGGLEFTVEANGPDLLDMVDDLTFMLEQSRVALFVDHYFDQLPEFLKKVPHEGLYLIIPDKYIITEKEYSKFIKANF